ncbi:hypothetical protein [Aquimarina algiphila]|uniref:Uncharacterized protein n=1 Tax=Aquimarina algiphila TaxID=2047982 RepID=A0A554VRQ0_9FLAO|nr:hypothetical protein [Aquimarina algiphila]TSE11329.1 hypothetical protein FOF46_01485 [Aquimarina algiphila]
MELESRLKKNPNLGYVFTTIIRDKQGYDWKVVTSKVVGQKGIICRITKGKQREERFIPEKGTTDIILIKEDIKSTKEDVSRIHCQTLILDLLESPNKPLPH